MPASHILLDIVSGQPSCNIYGRCAPFQESQVRVLLVPYKHIIKYSRTMRVGMDVAIAIGLAQIRLA